MVANFTPVNIITNEMKIYNFKFNTDYHQFYIEDGNDESKGNAHQMSFGMRMLLMRDLH